MLKWSGRAVLLVLVLGFVETGWAADPELIGTPNGRLQHLLNQRLDAVYKDMPVAEAAGDLTSRAGVWIYTNATAPTAPRVTLELKQATLREVLIELARQGDLQLVCNLSRVSLLAKAPDEKLQALATRLTHADPLERCIAVYDLARFQDVRAFKLIAEAFADPDPAVRHEVLNAVQRLNYFVHFTGSSDAVAQALAAQIKENAAAKRVDHRIYPLLATLGPRAEPLLDSMEITNENAFYVANGLAAAGSEKAIGQLCAQLKTHAQNNTYNVIHALGEAGTPAALAALQEALKRPEAKTSRAWLMRAIASMGSEEALAVIKAELPECDGTIKAQFIDVLSTVPSKTGEALLVELAEDKDVTTSFTASLALARRGHPLGAATLPLSLEKLDPKSRIGLLQSKLYYITDPAVYKELASSDDTNVRAVAHIMLACLTKDPNLVPAALEHFAKLEPGNRYSVVYQLARLRDPRIEQHFLNELKQPADAAQTWNHNSYYVFSDGSVDTIFELLQSDKAAVRAAAAGALGRSTSPRAIALLLKALAQEYNDQDKVQSTHAKLISALTPHVANPEVRAALIALALKPGASGKAAGIVIANSDDPSPLLTLADSADPKLRAHAATVLATQEPRQRHRLFKLLVDEDNTVRAAVGPRMNEFIAGYDVKLAGLLPRLINDSEVSIRAGAAALLSREPAGTAVPLLLELSTKGDDSGKAAIRALAMFDDPRVIARLLELATPEHAMRFEASSALYGIIYRFKLDPEKKAEIEKQVKAIHARFGQPVPPPQQPKEQGQVGEF